MDPTPVFALAVVLAAGAAVLWAIWYSESPLNAAVGGGFVAAGVAFVTPAFYLLLCAIGDGYIFRFPEVAVPAVCGYGMVFGVASVVLATVPGVIAAMIGRAVTLALCPVGPHRGAGETLATAYGRLGGTMTLTKALLLIFGFTAVGGALGCLGGYLLGTYNPAYYRGVFAGGQRPEFDPVAVGIGLGLSQWAAGGLVVGVILVFVLTWHDLRCRQIAADAARPTAREEATAPADTRVMRDAPRPG
jgi:hypothetical protein